MLLGQTNQKPLSYLQFVLFHCLHIRCTFLRQLSLLFWLRAILLLILPITGIFGIIGDQVYLKGIQQGNLLKLEVARYLFPFEREILIGPAQLYFRNKLATKETLNIYKDVLTYDPYSVQFLGVYIQLEYHYGNKNEALTAYKKLKLIAPNSNVLKRINETMKGLQ